MRKASLMLFVLCVVVPWNVQGADWPQWGGPAGTGVSPEKGLLKTWPKGGPTLVWTFEDAGTGFTSPVVVGGKVYLAGADAKDEILFCLDNKGKQTWKTTIGPIFLFNGNNWSRGPNASPAISGDSLVAMDSQGEVLCVNPADGKERWRKNLPKALDGEVNPIGGGPPKMGWGYCAAPLINGEQVIVTPGGPKGLLAALDLKTGNLLWQSKDVPVQATYAAPVIAEIGKVKQVIALTQEGVVGVSLKDGSLLWEFKREKPFPDVVCNSPIVQGNQVFMTAGFGGGADLVEVTENAGKFETKGLWSKREMSNKQGGAVLVGKEVYGSHETRDLVCQDWATGAKKWSSGRQGVGPGSVLAADGMLIYLGENKGEVTLVEASPKAYKELGRFTLPKDSTMRLPSGRIWTHPVLSDGLLYLRDQELLFCFKVK